VDQYLNNRRTELLWELLANPTAKGGEYAYNLHQLVIDFPHSGILQALLLYAGEEESLQRAATYTNPGLLYKLTHDPENLLEVTSEQIVNLYSAPRQQTEQLLEQQPEVVDDAIEEQPSEETAPEALLENPEYVVVATENTEAVAEQDELPVDIAPEGQVLTAEQVREEIAEEEAIKEEATEEEPTSIVEPLIELEEKETEPEHYIDDEVYDEIQSIDDINLSNKHNATENNTVHEPAADDTPDVPVLEDEDDYEPDGEPAPNDRRGPVNYEEQKLILGNIASTDFFVFDKAFRDKKKTEVAVNEPQPAASKPYAHNIPAKYVNKQRVSIYNDDKMPYSFLWWLNKTRKEHSGIYQPYVEFTLDTTQDIKQAPPADELQHQYVENIFHLTSFEELDRSTGQQPVEFDPKRKEDVIIERFIQEVPQIKPQSGDKLDNENKARKIRMSW
jgi:hypothetical protein